ncbi:MAG: Colicin production protein [Frankiales bacterium]|nr:Colicin production protein [Frankiales bacterium]
MRGDLLDVFLVVAAGLFALSGYRQGFVVGVLSFVGFLGGGVLGARFAPDLAGTPPFDALPQAVVGLGLVFLAASVGQVLATVLGASLRDRLTWRPARIVDALAGSVVSVVSVLLVAWLVGTAVASSPFPTLASQVRRSVVIAAVNSVVPPEGKRFFDGFRRLIDQRGFPEVIGGGLTPTRVRDVDPPNGRLAQSPVVQGVREEVLKITGIARSCSKRIEGTGFVYARNRVMTNAHVVAGVRDPEVQVGDRQLKATVVVFDPQRDIAVLRVPDLGLAPLQFAPEAADPGDDAIIVGYPNNGPFRADAARISGTQRARGPDIYRRDEQVVRQIYALRGRVRPGNSGGPLLDLQGRVYGVVFAAAADRRDIGYALTAREVAGDARLGIARSTPVSTQSCS